MPPEIREPTYFLLAALLDGPLHGYAIAQRASELSDGRVRLTAGTLYGALDRLVKQGMLVEIGDELVAGRKRRSYSLTSEGRTALHEEATRMRSAAAIVEGAGATRPAKAVEA
ncbi:MAG: helix-turn-helix transcriptional regulator [Solirubrobacterales bacterium]|nr:helix-turn-helix transcriptional regulator [Solirubrobacterales bacterium]OJU93950.1 MAG: PadR family transcriptional regulator [Solirubrobacterales bacterium 67-14]